MELDDDSGEGIHRAKVLLAGACLLVIVGLYLASVRVATRFDVLERKIAALRAENAQLRRQVTGRPAKPAASAGARDASQDAGSNAGETSLSIGSAATEPGGLIERVIQLKRYLSLHPDKAIPEMRLLTDEDWLKQLTDVPLDTEASERKALALLRQAAKDRFGQMAASAMKDYMAANNGQQPGTAAQITPYLAQQEDADLLLGFEKADPAAVHGGSAGWILQNEPVVDDWYDSTYYIGVNQFLSKGNGAGWAVEQAIGEYQKANGAPPTDPSQIVPFLKGDFSPATLNAIYTGLQASPGAPPTVPSGSPPLGPRSNAGIGHL
jgi:hypothetical protein